MTRFTPELHAAYLATRFCAWLALDEVIELRIGERNPRLAALMHEHGVEYGCFITAWNPYSDTRSDEDNAEANRALEVELHQRGWPLFPGEGRGEDPAWPPEASFLALGPDGDEAAALCCGYAQHAVVIFDASARPRLLVGQHYADRDQAFRDARMLAPKLGERDAATGEWTFDWKGIALAAPTENALVAALTRVLRDRHPAR